MCCYFAVWLFLSLLQTAYHIFDLANMSISCLFLWHNIRHGKKISTQSHVCMYSCMSCICFQSEIYQLQSPEKPTGFFQKNPKKQSWRVIWAGLNVVEMKFKIPMHRLLQAAPLPPFWNPLVVQKNMAELLQW